MADMSNLPASPRSCKASGGGLGRNRLHTDWIVFNSATDPQVARFVASLARPGGNLTGVSQLRSAVVAKRLQMLHEIVPVATLIGVLVNPANRTYTQE
jgi:ABC-type uncharacterized transport system substrate-binding protein